MSEQEVKNKIVSIAESVRAEILFDLQFDISESEFFKLKFQNDSFEMIKVCSIVYKYSF